MVNLEFSVQGLRHVRVTIGRRTFRTYGSSYLKAPRGSSRPTLIYSVEWTDKRDGHSSQLGAFMEERIAEACVAKLESEGWADLYVNMIPVHERLQDWQWDR